MSSLQVLLALDPGEALVKMFNDANDTSYRLDGFEFSLPTVVAGFITEVTLTGKTSHNVFEDQWTPGSFTLTYNRLEMDTFLQGILDHYHPVLPLSTQNILDEITALIGQKFYIDDMVLEEITRDTASLYRLKAKPESLRWVGYIDLPLITLTPLAIKFDSNLIAGVVDNSQVVFSPNVSLPLMNATDYRTMAQSLRVGDLAQDRANFVTLFNAVVHDPTPVNPNPSPWYTSPTPGPFNLYNATVLGFSNGGNLNPAIPNLESSLLVVIDGDHTTNFQDGTLVIPFTAIDFNTDGYTNKPRLTQGSSISLSDGTDFNGYLNGILAGHVFTTVPENFLIDGAQPWICNDGLPSPTNLAGATVTYNGQRRATDVPPATQGLDRLLIVELTDNNSVWAGTYAFYYAGIIQMPISNVRTTVGGAVYVDFTPTSGTGPFTYAISEGALPPTLTLDTSSGLLTGTVTTVGNYLYTLAITDTFGNVCTFAISHAVTDVVTALSLKGTLPNGVLSDPYVGFLDISGGLAPYTQPTVVAGYLPDSIQLTLTGSSIRVAGLWPAADTYHFSIGIASTDGQSTSLSFNLTVTS